MIRKNRKEVALFVASFLLLCVISVYKQISENFLPDDPFRPIIVFFVYLMLLAVWWSAIYSRVVQRNMRVFLLAEHFIMLLWIIIRFIQATLIYHDIYLSRISGYLVSIPLVFLPLFGLYASFGLGRGEDYRISRKWYCFLIPAGIIVSLMLTNESHHFVFRQFENEVQPNLYYHPNAGIFILLLWSLSILIARIFLIYRISRKLKASHSYSAVPFLIAVFVLIFNIPYFYSSFVVIYELIEYSVFLFFLEVMIWESCIIIGMVPVNSHYEDVFDLSTVAMHIVDEDGHNYLKSSCASEISSEIFNLLKQQQVVLTPEGQELHLHTIRGGYCIWQNDVSQTIAIIKELHKSTEKLEYEGELLRQELKVRSDETTVKEQNRIYNQLTDDIGGQLLLLRNLLGKRESVIDKVVLFREICLIGTYIKRRCNLRLIAQSDGKIPNKELALCYTELAGCLQQMEVKTDVFWNTTNDLASEFAIFSVDIFELLLEYERFNLHSIRITFETDTYFSIQVQKRNGISRQLPVDELQRIKRENYDVSWRTFENGYQLSVCIEKV